MSSILISIAKFPSYYSWLIVIPIAVAIISGLSVCELGSAKFATVVLCLMSILGGAGANAVAYASEAPDHDYRLIEGFVAESVRETDVAYVDPEVYFAARQLAGTPTFQILICKIISKMSQKQQG